MGLRPLLLLSCLCLSWAAGGDEALPDPTRPPAAAALVPAAGSAAEAPPLVLQSVRISAQARYATISGQLLREGEPLGSARLVRVEATQAVLQEGATRRVLKLLPQAEKYLSPPEAAAGRARFATQKRKTPG